MTTKKIRSIFLIEPELKAKAEQLADEQGISYSSLIRKLIVNYVDGGMTIEDEIEEIKRRLDALAKRIKK